MRNPFLPPDDVSPGEEAELRGFFAPMAAASMSAAGSASARLLMSRALLAEPEPRDWGPVARRVAVAVAAVAAPLATVGAVGAMTGNDTLAKPVTLVASVASHVVHGEETTSRPQDQAPSIPPPPPREFLPTATVAPPTSRPGAPASAEAGQASPMHPATASGACPVAGCIPWVSPTFNFDHGQAMPQPPAGAASSASRTPGGQSQAGGAESIPTATGSSGHNGASCADSGTGTGAATTCVPGSSGEHRQDGSGPKATATPPGVQPGNGGDGNSQGTHGNGSGNGNDAHGMNGATGDGHAGHGNQGH